MAFVFQVTHPRCVHPPLPGARTQYRGAVPRGRHHGLQADQEAADCNDRPLVNYSEEPGLREERLLACHVAALPCDHEVRRQMQIDACSRLE
eukprot:6606100-Pyramimonas_sp.AAC.1